jgi:hypothetical protein
VAVGTVAAIAETFVGQGQRWLVRGIDIVAG